MEFEIPIFIIVHDRVTCLKRSVKSFLENINTPIKLIFHNNLSTYSPCIDYLNQMRNEGHIVYDSNINSHKSINNSVRDYLNKHPECEYFVITDPDIELNNKNSDILEFYIYHSKKFNNKRVIGPMLKIDDIPDHYPYKNKTIVKHTDQFWHKKPHKIQYKDVLYDFQFALIDTTFQLCHRSFKDRDFAREGIRTYYPTMLGI